MAQNPTPINGYYAISPSRGKVGLSKGEFSYLVRGSIDPAFAFKMGRQGINIRRSLSPITLQDGPRTPFTIMCRVEL